MTIKNEIQLSSTTVEKTTSTNDIDFGLTAVASRPPPPHDLEAYGTNGSMTTFSNPVANNSQPSSSGGVGGLGGPQQQQQEDQMIDPIEYQKRIRKKQCYIILITVIAMVVMLFATGMIP